MKRVFKAALVIGGVAAGAAIYALTDRNIDAPKTADFVDLGRYAGLWYEIARYPNRFQRACVADATANYTLLSNGRLTVVHTCRKSYGAVERASGTARVVDRKTNARLKVTFYWPLSVDYWILDVGHEYEYAVVGEPGRDYLWILSRTPHLDEAVYQRIIKRLEARGLDTARLVKTPQTGQGLLTPDTGSVGPRPEMHETIRGRS
jgi:apolipoprotein D and lipocalin family protein